MRDVRWTCLVCTLSNSSTLKYCDACNALNPDKLDEVHITCPCSEMFMQCRLLFPTNFQLLELFRLDHNLIFINQKKENSLYNIFYVKLSRMYYSSGCRKHFRGDNCILLLMPTVSQGFTVSWCFYESTHKMDELK